MKKKELISGRNNVHMTGVRYKIQLRTKRNAQCSEWREKPHSKDGDNTDSQHKDKS